MADMDEVVRIPLTLEEKAEYGERLSRMLAERKALVDQRKQAMEEAQADIDTLQAQIDVLAEDLREGRRETRQGDLFVEDLFVDGKLPPNQAARTLAKVATLPSEPHAYHGKRKECGVCGAGKEDPIHGEARTEGDATTTDNGSGEAGEDGKSRHHGSAVRPFRSPRTT